MRNRIVIMPNGRRVHQNIGLSIEGDPLLTMSRAETELIVIDLASYLKAGEVIASVSLATDDVSIVHTYTDTEIDLKASGVQGEGSVEITVTFSTGLALIVLLRFSNVRRHYADRRNVMYGAESVPGASILTMFGNLPEIMVGDGFTVLPGAATLTMAGNIPTIIVDNIVHPGAAIMTLAGQVPEIRLVVEMVASPPAATLTLAGQTPQITLDKIVVPQAASLTMSGNLPLVTMDMLSSPGAAAMTITGNIPEVLTANVHGVRRTTSTSDRRITSTDDVRTISDVDLPFSWLPTEIPGLVLFIDPTDRNTLFTRPTGTGSNNFLALLDDPVGTALDKSGLQNNLEALGNRDRPLLKYNGDLSWFEYDGDADLLKTVADVLNYDTLSCCVGFLSKTSNAVIAGISHDVTNVDPFFRYGISHGAGNTLDTRLDGVLDVGSVDLGTDQIHIAEFYSTDGTSHVDGVLNSTGTGGLITYPNAGVSLVMGSNIDEGDSFEGNIYGIVVYNRDLDEHERLLVRTYMSIKTGIEGLLEV